MSTTFKYIFIIFHFLSLAGCQNNREPLQSEAPNSVGSDAYGSPNPAVQTDESGNQSNQTVAGESAANSGNTTPGRTNESAANSGNTTPGRTNESAANSDNTTSGRTNDSADNSRSNAGIENQAQPPSTANDIEPDDVIEEDCPQYLTSPVHLFSKDFAITKVKLKEQSTVKVKGINIDREIDSLKSSSDVLISEKPLISADKLSNKYQLTLVNLPSNIEKVDIYWLPFNIKVKSLDPKGKNQIVIDRTFDFESSPVVKVIAHFKGTAEYKTLGDIRDLRD